MPLPRSVKIKGAAATRVLKSLIKKGLLAEMPATGDAAAWRRSEDGRMTLVVTEAGLQAIGITSDEVAGKWAAATKPQPKRRNRRAERKLTTTRATTKEPPPAVRQGTKQALLIDLLERKKGATIEAIVDTLGWLPHTVRAALTRLRQQGVRIERVREDGVSRYHIAEDRKAA